MDGSAAAFVAAVDGVGIRELLRPRKFIKVLKPVRVEEGTAWGELRPHSGFRLDVESTFVHAAGEKLALPSSAPCDLPAPQAAAWVDLCHMLMNANEFVYRN